MSQSPTLPLAESSNRSNILESYNNQPNDQENEGAKSLENRKMQSENDENLLAKNKSSKTKLNVKI